MAAAFHDPEALRLLGMAEARCFNGKPDLTAAIAYWHNAAGRGDALAQLELAHFYYQGVKAGFLLRTIRFQPLPIHTLQTCYS